MTYIASHTRLSSLMLCLPVLAEPPLRSIHAPLLKRRRHRHRKRTHCTPRRVARRLHPSVLHRVQCFSPFPRPSLRIALRRCPSTLATRRPRAGARGFLRLSQFARRIRPTRASRSPLRCPPVSYGYNTRSQSQSKDRARTRRATASRARARTCTSVRT